MRKAKDITGQQFNRLTAIRHLGKSKWLCQCECGKQTKVTISDLIKGNIKSCGCLYDERRTLTTINDERAKTLYGTWKQMNKRCRNKDNPRYKDYAGKGIKVCDEWKNSFEAFYQWAIENGYEDIEGERKDRLAIDRINSDGDYCPENCRWITGSENSSRVRPTNEQLEELLKQSSDELVQQYIERKIELNQEIQKEKKAILSFPTRKSTVKLRLSPFCKTKSWCV